MGINACLQIRQKYLSVISNYEFKWSPWQSTGEASYTEWNPRCNNGVLLNMTEQFDYNNQSSDLLSVSFEEVSHLVRPVGLLASHKQCSISEHIHILKSSILNRTVVCIHTDSEQLPVIRELSWQIQIHIRENKRVASLL